MQNDERLLLAIAVLILFAFGSACCEMVPDLFRLMRR